MTCQACYELEINPLYAVMTDDYAGLFGPTHDLEACKKFLDDEEPIKIDIYRLFGGNRKEIVRI